VEYRGQWVAILGKCTASSFQCMIVGVYAANSVSERRTLWSDLIILKNAFELPMVVLGDFNGTLHRHERSSGFLNVVGSSNFGNFILDCELLEFHL
jgi:hypothetical protein